MKFKIVHNEPLEFDKGTARDGDIYLYRDDKLLYIGNCVIGNTKLSLFEKIKKWFDRKKERNIKPLSFPLQLMSIL